MAVAIKAMDEATLAKMEAILAKMVAEKLLKVKAKAEAVTKTYWLVLSSTASLRDSSVSLPANWTIKEISFFYCSYDVAIETTVTIKY